VHVFKVQRILKFGAVHGLWYRPALLSLSVSPLNSCFLNSSREMSLTVPSSSTQLWFHVLMNNKQHP
jgi:hypothetical protein